MPKKCPAAFCVACIILVISCNKKQVPQHGTDNTVGKTTAASTEVKKPAVKPIPVLVPKVIVVNDSVAKKNIDGRLYYDLAGHRYWRNYNDGKYYLFNKSMYTDNAFKPH